MYFSHAGTIFLYTYIYMWHERWRAVWRREGEQQNWDSLGTGDKYEQGSMMHDKSPNEKSLNEWKYSETYILYTEKLILKLGVEKAAWGLERWFSA